MRQMTTKELGDLILNGQPGSQQSLNSLAELIRRNRAVKLELKYVWGVVPEPPREAPQTSDRMKRLKPLTAKTQRGNPCH